MMDGLDKELMNLGFSEDFIASINEAKQFDDYDVKIENPNYQPCVNETTSSTEIEVTQEPTTCSNFLVENG
jgi:hypothetical protein